MITVLLADDHSLVRKGFRRMLEDDPEIQVVGEACDGSEAVRLARELAPQVIVMDMSFMCKFLVQGKDAGKALNYSINLKTKTIIEPSSLCLRILWSFAIHLLKTLIDLSMAWSKLTNSMKLLSGRSWKNMS